MTDEEQPSTDPVLVRYQGLDTAIHLPDREDAIQKRIAESGMFYELGMLEDVVARVEPGGVALDVGANIGNHSLFFARYVGLTVHAFEPLTTSYDILVRNIELNDLSETIIPHHCGLGATASRASVEIVDASNLGRTMLKRDGQGAESVEIKTLDSFEFQNVSLLKIDVEGMELEVLRGGLDTIRREKPYIYLEAQTPAFLHAAEGLLASCGYTVVDRFNNTPTYVFAPLDDPKQMAVATNKRLGEVYRDVRVLSDRIAKVPTSVSRLGERLDNRLKSVGADTSQRTDALTEAVRGSHEATKRLHGEVTALSATVRAELVNDIEAAVQKALSEQREVPAAMAEMADALSNLSDQPSHELRRLQYINDLYRRKIETLLGSTSWRLTEPVRTAARRAKGDDASGMSAAAFFEKVDKRANALPRRKRKRRRFAAEGMAPRSGPRRSGGRATLDAAIEVPVTQHEFDVRARFPSSVDVAECARHQTVFAGMAAIPERQEAMRRSVASILPQVDRLGVFLNGFEEVPKWLNDPKIVVVRSQDHEDRGDAGKFFWVDGHQGFYLTVDDDIVYCDDYVERLLSAIRVRSYSTVVGWHGSLLKTPFGDYYSNHSRRVFSFAFHRPHDTPVHVLGTGCMAMHTQTIRVRHADFKTANMADVYFAKLAQEQSVPLVVVAHEKDELVAIEEAQDSSINGDARSDIDSIKNTRKQQNDTIASIDHWRTFEWDALQVLLIGRFEKFLKGGIHKSCMLIASELEARGNKVLTLDTHRPLTTLPGPVDIAWIYPGDPARPDYETVDDKIRFLRSQGVPVLVNFSHLYLAERSQWIAEQIKKFNTGPGARVFAAVFTESLVDDPHLVDLQDYVLMVPKTISTLPPDTVPSFDEREGICLGDASKLGNPTIIGGSVKPWIDAVSRRLPHVQLYGYKQYSGKEVDSRLTLVPHMSEGFGEWLAQRRVFVCLNRHLTFEMVACEAQRGGTPVVYRHMPHSLSEYIGPTGLRVREPEELAEVCAWLYNDRSAWRQFSKASSLNGEAIDVAHHTASLEASLRMALLRAR